MADCVLIRELVNHIKSIQKWIIFGLYNEVEKEVIFIRDLVLLDLHEIWCQNNLDTVAEQARI
jgi:hypothetical protein